MAERGEGSGPLVAICCEYDALPDIGHACGHNVIAAAGLGAALAAGAVATAAGGRVRVLGTPAEEGGNGKGLLAEFGAFDDVDAVLMVHPGDRDLRSMTTLAASSAIATYHGKAAHAAGVAVARPQRPRRRRARLLGDRGDAPAAGARPAGARHVPGGPREVEHHPRAGRGQVGGKGPHHR